MREINIHGLAFNLADKWEVTYESVERVENLIPKLFFARINPFSFENNQKDEDQSIDSVFEELIKDPEKFVGFLKLMTRTESIQRIMCVMLTTGKTYDELIQLPALILSELVKESEKEIGTLEDFTQTFNMNISSNPLELLNNLKLVSAI
jgi:hypothetical protein